MQDTSPPSMVVDIPVGGIEVDSHTGVDTALVDGQRLPVQFDLDQRVWTTAHQDGTPSLALACLNDDSRLRRVELPGMPAVPLNARPIPQFLHFVWVGHRLMPEALVNRVLLNALRTPGFRTIVHVGMDDPSLLAAMRNRLTDRVPWVNVLSLDDEPCFSAFRELPVHRYYRAFIEETTRNYGAASDLLRLWLVYAYGGVYLDVDDVFADEVDINAHLLAARGDLLLGSRYSDPLHGFAGYNQSHFASHAGNPVLMCMLDEACLRLEASPAFFADRPWGRPGEPEDHRMNAYIRAVFHLTGPQLFTDMISALRPDIASVEANLLRAMEVLHYSPDRPRYRAESYLATANAALMHYLPFRDGPFRVVIGSAGSWNDQNV
ncbi:glycosyltransferase [Pinirhizobacter soli]|uniref:glycosyltransferase n=1 Tax=Pinirhizobacter soli TaxID=2786953 RepID=UPI00202A595E|nr:glycosyltransferase [Pinirhizobacter soli]